MKSRTQSNPVRSENVHKYTYLTNPMLQLKRVSLLMKRGGDHLNKKYYCIIGVLQVLKNRISNNLERVGEKKDENQ